MTEPKRDEATVTSGGELLAPLPEGVSFHQVTTHVDDRGWVCEIFDPRWGWSQEPLRYVYATALRSGAIKGWAMHEKNEDRYFILLGEVELVLYDDRANSATRGQVFKIYLSHYNRRLVNIPAGVWHANRNVGEGEAVIISCPTTFYDHDNPDKFRLPLDNDVIPFRFDV